MAIADRATTRSARATSPRSACRCWRGARSREQDRAGGAQVCVINETFARRFFDGRHPIGLHVTQRYADQQHTYEVVGVVKDSRQNRLRGRIEHRFYTPATQPAASISAVSFIIRPRGDGADVLPAVRRVIQQAEPRMTITRAGVLGEAIDRRLSQDRMVAQLSIAFGVVAALLAAMGLYGVLSYGVARRTQELGVRKALGARHATLMGMILRETGWLLAAGLLVGGALAAGAVQLIASRLYGLSPADPVTFGDRHRRRSPSSRSWRRGCRRIARRGSIRWSRCARNSAELAPATAGRPRPRAILRIGAEISPRRACLERRRPGFRAWRRTIPPQQARVHTLQRVQRRVRHHFTPTLLEGP